MKPISSLKFFFLTNFSNPVCDRAIYRAIKKSKASSILEIGMGNANRSETMIRVAKKFSRYGNIRYTGIDTFEANHDSPITLKDCHQRLGKLDAKIQLVPGDVFSSLHRIANSHTRTDLLIISSGVQKQALEKSWFYVPRMLHAASTVFLQGENDLDGKFEKLSRIEIERLVKASSDIRIKAAA